jgi:hypothetical protein
MNYGTVQHKHPMPASSHLPPDPSFIITPHISFHVILTTYTKQKQWNK